MPRESLPVGTYVCRVVHLEARDFGRYDDGDPYVYGCELRLAVAHGPHAGRFVAVIHRTGGEWLPQVLLKSLREEWDDIDQGKFLQRIGPTFVQLVRVAVPPGKAIARCAAIAGASTFPCRTGKLGPNQLDALARAALGADQLLSFEETLARYRALAADELAAVFGSTVAGRARR